VKTALFLACVLVLSAAPIPAAEESAAKTERLKKEFEIELSAKSAEALAHAYRREGIVKEGIAYFKSRQKGSPTRGAAALTGLCVLYRESGRPEAMDFCLGALERYRAMGDREGEAVLCNETGVAHLLNGAYDEAQRLLEKSLALRREIGDAPGRLETMSNLGALWNYRGDFTKSLECLTQAAGLAEELSEKFLAMVIAGNLAMLYGDMGDSEKAMAAYARSEALARELGDQKELARTLSGMASQRSDMGDYAGALRLFERSMDISREIGDPRAEAVVLNNMALLYETLGDTKRAMALAQSSLTRRREIGDRRGEAVMLNNIGQMLQGEKRYAEARPLFERSLVLRRELGDRRGEAVMLNNMALLLEDEGRRAEALPFHVQSLALRRELGMREAEIRALSNMAELEAETGHAEDARRHGAEAMALLGQNLSSVLVYQVHHSRGQVLKALGEHSGAARHYRMALAEIENMRALLETSGQRSGFFAKKTTTYERLVEVLLAEDLSRSMRETKDKKWKMENAGHLSSSLFPFSSGGESFSVSERMKARSFLDEMASAKFLRGGVAPELMEKKRLLEARMKWLRERP
jgi:tetratricopeptide (TPR) repeat protein